MSVFFIGINCLVRVLKPVALPSLAQALCPFLSIEPLNKRTRPKGEICWWATEHYRHINLWGRQLPRALPKPSQ